MHLYNILRMKSLSVNELVFATSVLLWGLCLRLYVLVFAIGKRLFSTWLLLYRTWENRSIAELRRGVVRSIKVCSAKLAWSHPAIVLLVTVSRSTPTQAMWRPSWRVKTVGEMKTKMNEMNATSSSSQASVVATLDNDVLMALPKRKTVARTLQRARQKAATAASWGTPMPPVPSDLQFAIPIAFIDMVLYDSGPGDDRMILMGCAKLFDGLARADLWLADGTFKAMPNVFFQLYSIHFDFGIRIRNTPCCLLLPRLLVEPWRLRELTQR